MPFLCIPQHRTKPANRAKKARSSSQESESANRKSKSPSSHPKLYPIGDGTYAPLDYILSLRTGYNGHPPDNNPPVDRSSLGSAHGNNAYTDHQHYDQTAFFNHDRTDHVATILNNHNNHNAENDLPTSTARLPSIGRGIGMQTNYGSMSSQLDSMLLPPIGSFDLGSDLVPDTHNKSAHLVRYLPLTTRFQPSSTSLGGWFVFRLRRSRRAILCTFGVSHDKYIVFRVD